MFLNLLTEITNSKKKDVQYDHSFLFCVVREAFWATDIYFFEEGDKSNLC